MNCRQFDEWLDVHEEPSADARAHALSCERCAGILRAAEQVDAALLAATLKAPEGFTDRVMSHVAAVEATRSAQTPAPLRDAFPWWVRVASDPSVAAALLLCALVLWKADAIQAGGLAFLNWLGALPILAPLESGGSGDGSPAVAAFLTYVVLPASAWLALSAFRWSRGLVVRATRAA